MERSSRFIRNSRNQFQKNLIGMSDRDSRVYPLYGRDDGEVRRRIADRLRKVPEGKNVLFLGRYNHDVNIQDVVRIPYVADDADEMGDLIIQGNNGMRWNCKPC